MNPLVALGIGFGLGLIAIILLGLVFPQRYYAMAMGILARAVLVRRENGGWWLRASRSENGMEVVGDQTWKDELGVMGRLCGHPFGLAHGKRRIIYTPRLAEIGELFDKRTKDGQQSYRADGGYYENGYVPIDWGADRAVNPDGILSLLWRSGDPEQNSRIDDFVEWGQELFTDSSLGDWLKPIMAFLIVYGAMFAIRYLIGELLSGGGGGGATPQPMLLAVGVWVPW